MKHSHTCFHSAHTWHNAHCVTFRAESGKPTNQMIGYDLEQKATERNMNAWTLRLCVSQAVRGMQGVAGSRYVVLYKWVWRVWTWFATLSGASEAVSWVGLIRYENAVAVQLWPVHAVHAEGELCAWADCQIRWYWHSHDVTRLKPGPWKWQESDPWMKEFA